jgi:hypothetical protein
MFRLRCWTGVALAACAAAAAGQQSARLTDGWTPVDAGLLAATRGGFKFGSGLEVSLGIERLVSINGSVVARTSFEVADLGTLSAGQAEQARVALSAVKLIQNGNHNVYAPALSAQTLGGTVIQNSLNDQAIGSQTVISASVNSLELLKALNLQGTLREAVARAAGTP